MVRRIPDPNKAAAGQDSLFDTWRFHAFLTTSSPEVMDTVKVEGPLTGRAVLLGHPPSPNGRVARNVSARATMSLADNG